MQGVSSLPFTNDLNIPKSFSSETFFPVHFCGREEWNLTQKRRSSSHLGQTRSRETNSHQINTTDYREEACFKPNGSNLSPRKFEFYIFSESDPVSLRAWTCTSAGNIYLPQWSCWNLAGTTFSNRIGWPCGYRKYKRPEKKHLLRYTYNCWLSK